MDDSSNPAAPAWTASPSAKKKNAVQRAVNALLDELAPEKVLKRAEQLRGAVEQHRTPNGCVLQAPKAAVSVSWFEESTNEAVLGELHVVVWNGIVSRRGAPARAEGAKVVKELVLHPIDGSTDDCLWKATNGKQFDTAALVSKVLALLEEQVTGSGTRGAQGNAKA